VNDRAHDDAGTPGNEDPHREESGPEAPQPAPGRRSRRRLFIVVGLLVLAALVGIPIYLYERQYESTDDAFVEGHVVQVSPRISGHVTRLLVDDNQEVAEGALLVEIDPRDYEARADQKRALLEAARGRLEQARDQVDRSLAELAEAEAEVAAAESEADRTRIDRERYEAAGDAVTRQGLDNARAAAVSAAAQLRAAREKVIAAKTQVPVARSQVAIAEAEENDASAELREAELQLSYTKVYAPEAGRVTRRSVEAGNFVQIGEALLALVPRDVWVIANFRETQLDLMRPGQRAWIRIDAYPERRFLGKVDSITAGTGARFSLLPPENATGNYVKVVQRVPVKILFDGPREEDLVLGVGMSAVPTVEVR
jgi:membrane fusion protein (multidrug efflux system)